MRRVFAALAVLSLCAASSNADAPAKAKSATVTHVSDGDTAYLDPLKYGTTASSWDGRKARFIGVDTPEIPPAGDDCYGEESSAFTKRKLDGKDVKVTYGVDPIDPYDRALVYIWLNGKLFNAQLIRKGYARVEIYEPNDRYEAKFRKLQRAAKQAERGRWGACP